MSTIDDEGGVDGCEGSDLIFCFINTHQIRLVKEHVESLPGFSLMHDMVREWDGRR